MDSNDVIRQARSLKGSAMDARDLEDWDEAELLLDRAENILSASLANLLKNPNPGREVDPAVLDFQASIANIRGSRGGLYRRQKKFEKAVRAYDAGSEMERQLDATDRPNSYNLVQRLVARAFFDPVAIDRIGETILDLDMKAALQAAEDEVRRQIKVARGSDAYAWADLFQVLILLDKSEWQAVLKLNFLLLPSLDRYSLEVTLEVIHQLASRAREMNAPMDVRLETSIGLLQKELDRINAGQRRISI